MNDTARRSAWASAFVYVALTAVMGRHVLGALGTKVAGNSSDPMLNAAILTWNALSVPWSDAWYQFPIYYPMSDALTLSEHLLGLSVVATPLYWITGNGLAAYNLTLLLAYPLSALAMYALVWRLTLSAPSAFLSGLAFGFAPYRAGHLGHIQLLAVFWAPLALLGLHEYIETRRSRPPAAADHLSLCDRARAVCALAGSGRTGLLWRRHHRAVMSATRPHVLGMAGRQMRSRGRAVHRTDAAGALLPGRVGGAPRTAFRPRGVLHAGGDRGVGIVLGAGAPFPWGAGVVGRSLPLGGWLSTNGASGYFAPHYAQRWDASDRADPTMFAPYLARGDLHVVVDESKRPLVDLVEREAGVEETGRGEGRRQYRIPRMGPASRATPGGERRSIASVSASCADEPAAFAIDDDPATRWQCGPQTSDQTFTIDLGAVTTAGALVHALGAFPNDFPRHLIVETSIDRMDWQEAWNGEVLTAIFEAKLRDARSIRFVVPFAPRPARFVRLRQVGRDESWYWSIVEVEVWSGM